MALKKLRDSPVKPLSEEEKKAIERLWERFEPRLESMRDDIKKYRDILHDYEEKGKIDNRADFWRSMVEAPEVKDLGEKVAAPKEMIELAPYLDRIARLNKQVRGKLKGIEKDRPIDSAYAIGAIRGMLR